MKTKIIAPAAALTMAGIVAWLALEGQADQPAPAAVAAREGKLPAPPEPTELPMTEPDRPSGEHDVLASASHHRRSTSLSTALSQASQGSTVVPVPTSTEHQELVSLGSPPEQNALRQMLEREPKDPAWAYDMEQRLRLMYESRGAQIYLVECRTTLCEVQSFSHRPDVDPHAPPVVREPGTIMPSVAGATTVNGRSTELAYFRRDQIDRQLELEAQEQKARASRQR